MIQVVAIVSCKIEYGRHSLWCCFQILNQFLECFPCIHFYWGGCVMDFADTKSMGKYFERAGTLVLRILLWGKYDCPKCEQQTVVI